jgi:(p)ppGpp synthase/HD superfamily hydrolase
MNDLIFDAIEYAALKHHGQYRKGTTIPYVFHPLDVARLLIECGCPQETVLAGILHDTVEDTDVTQEEIEIKFGQRVAWLVRQASEPDKGDSWENRKRHTLNHLHHIEDEQVLLLACADKLDNASSIYADYTRLGDTLWERFNRGYDQQKWYYTQLAAIFTERLTAEPGKTLAESFAKQVEAIFGS